MQNNPPKFQVNGVFEIKSNDLNECLEILQKCSDNGLKAISINIMEIKLLEYKDAE